MKNADTAVMACRNGTTDAVKRWSGVGPYYAMMPTSFALKQIKRFTRPGDVVLDPFCGRGTIPFAAAILGRSYFGIEIFPVGWVYSAVKCGLPTKERLITRLQELAQLRVSSIESSEFFQLAYSPKVLRFLCAARERLNWRTNQTDRTLMAFILISLHDKKHVGLSNQMRQTKAVHPDYAIRWWNGNHKMKPPDVDAVELITRKINWRYAKGVPKVSATGKIYLGDCTRLLSHTSSIRGVKLLFTSPPYFRLTNYYADQWLRNWMLGGPPRPKSGEHAYMKRFDSKAGYRDLLERAFGLAAKKLRRDAIVYVRTDARAFTLETTKQVLREIFPRKQMRTKASGLNGRLSQTALFGDKMEKPGEVDLVLW